MLPILLAEQRDSGMMQNFAGYMLETGAVLWSMGEHYRYTRDREWLRHVAPNLVRAREFLLAWRVRNQTPAGMGLIEGKVADTDDHFRQFMLNGYACLGMQRVGEMLADSDPEAAKRWSGEPTAVALRLPHPRGIKAGRCTGGEYDPETETVTLAGPGKVSRQFDP